MAVSLVIVGKCRMAVMILKMGLFSFNLSEVVDVANQKPSSWMTICWRSRREIGELWLWSGQVWVSLTAGRGPRNLGT